MKWNAIYTKAELRSWVISEFDWRAGTIQLVWPFNLLARDKIASQDGNIMMMTVMDRRKMLVVSFWKFVHSRNSGQVDGPFSSESPDVDVENASISSMEVSAEVNVCICVDISSTKSLCMLVSKFEHLAFSLFPSAFCPILWG